MPVSSTKWWWVYCAMEWGSMLRVEEGKDRGREVGWILHMQQSTKRRVGDRS